MNIIFGIILFFLGVFAGFLILWTIGRVVDGQLIITEDEQGIKKFILDLDIDPYYIDQKKIIKFEVVRGETIEAPAPPPMPKPPKSRGESQ
jgi:hypothetical protein